MYSKYLQFSALICSGILFRGWDWPCSHAHICWWPRLVGGAIYWLQVKSNEPLTYTFQYYRFYIVKKYLRLIIYIYMFELCNVSITFASLQYINFFLRFSMSIALFSIFWSQTYPLVTRLRLFLCTDWMNHSAVTWWESRHDPKHARTPKLGFRQFNPPYGIYMVYSMYIVIMGFQQQFHTQQMDKIGVLGHQRGRKGGI